MASIAEIMPTDGRPNRLPVGNNPTALLWTRIICNIQRNVSFHVAAITFILLLSACSSQPIVNVPIAQACIAQLPAKPVIRTDAELAALDDFQIVLAIREDELSLLNYSEQLEAVATPCTK